MGSNVGDLKQNLKNAIDLISQISGIEFIQSASYYSTKAWGKTDQNNFLNTVIEINTTLQATKLLDRTQRIEEAMGRTIDEKWSPRIIDIDILLYSQDVVNQPHLTIPHPYLTERSFVLAPLYEINKFLNIPNKGKIDKYINQKDLDLDILDIICC